MSGLAPLRALRRLVLDNPAAPVAAMLTLVGVGWVLQASQPLNHDLAWLLIATRRLLAGAPVYLDDVIEVNPPLILALLAPSVAIHQWLEVPLIATVRVTTGLLAVVSAALSGRVLDRILGRSERWLRRALQASLLYASVVFVDAHFGQREHFILILVMPYLCAAAARARGLALPRSLALAAGGLGGLGFAVKPTYVLALLLVEGALALRRRSLRVWGRPDLVAALAVGALYLAAVLHFTPGYFHVVFPLALDGYWVYQRPLSALLRARDLGLVGLGLLAAWWLRRDERLRDLGAVWCLASVSFYGLSLLQGTGWRYTVIAFQGTAVPLLALALLSRRREPAGGSGAPRGALAQGAGAALTALALLAALGLQPGLVHTLRGGAAWRAGRTAGAVRVLTEVIDARAAGGSVAFLTPVLRGPFPAVLYSRAEWASRFSCLWLVPAILRARGGDPAAPARLTPQRVAALERTLLDAVVEDLRRYQPELIFVDRRRRLPGYGGFELDLLAYFRRDPGFEAVWSHYRPVGDLPPYTIAARVPPRTAQEGPRASPRGRSTGSGRKVRSSSASLSELAKIR